MMKRCEEKLSTNYVMIQQFAEPASAAITWSNQPPHGRRCSAAPFHAALCGYGLWFFFSHPVGDWLLLGVAVLLYDPTSATLWPHVWGVHGWFHVCKVQIIATSLLMLSRRVFWVIGYICAHCSRGGLFRCSYAELHHAEMFLERAAVAQERRSSVGGLLLGCSSLCASLPFRARYQAPVALRCVHCSMNMCEWGLLYEALWVLK